jgi:hypothetical protein
MPAHWVAALPMYNVTPELAALWRAFLFDVVSLAFGDDPSIHVSLLDEPFGDLSALMSMSSRHRYSMPTAAKALIIAVSSSCRRTGAPPISSPWPAAADCAPHTTAPTRTAA